GPPAPADSKSVGLDASTTRASGGGVKSNVDGAGTSNEMSVKPSSSAVAPEPRATTLTSSGRPGAASAENVPLPTVEAGSVGASTSRYTPRPATHAGVSTETVVLGVT